MEALIIYTSLTGNTQACADIVAEALVLWAEDCLEELEKMG